MAYNVENGGVIKSLKEDGIVDLDTDFSSLLEWISMNGYHAALHFLSLSLSHSALSLSLFCFLIYASINL